MVRRALTYADKNRNPSAAENPAPSQPPYDPFDAGNYIHATEFFARYRLGTVPIKGPYHSVNANAEDAKFPFVNKFTGQGAFEKWTKWQRALIRGERWDNENRRMIKWDCKRATIGLLLECAPRPIAVVDVDDDTDDALLHALETFGDTPLIIKTPNGWHLYYLNPHRLETQMQKRCASKWDLKANGYVIAPMSYGVARADRHEHKPRAGYSATRYEWFNAPTDMKGDSDRKKLATIVKLIAFGDLPSLCPEAVARHWPKGGNVKPFQTVTAQTVKARVSKPAKPSQANQNHLGWEGTRDIPDGERGTAIYDYAMHKANDWPIGGRATEIPPEFRAAVSEFNDRRCDPPVKQSRVDSTVKSAWAMHARGANLYPPLGTTGDRERIDAIQIPSNVENGMGEAWDTRNWRAAVKKSLSPLLRAILYYNGTRRHFVITEFFISKNTGTIRRTSHKRFKDALEIAGLIEMVPAKISGYDKPWQMPDLDGNGGRAKLYRFTGRGRTMLAEAVDGKTAPVPTNVEKATTQLVTQAIATLSEKTLTPTKQENAKLKSCRKRHAAATVKALILDKSDTTEAVRKMARCEYDETFKALHREGFECVTLTQQNRFGGERLSVTNSSAGNQSGRNNGPSRLTLALDHLERIAFPPDTADPSS